MRQSAFRGRGRDRQGRLLQLLALQPVGRTAVGGADVGLQAAVGQGRGDRIPVQQASRAPSLLRDLRHPVVRVRQGAERQRDGDDQRPLPRWRRRRSVRGDDIRWAQPMSAAPLSGPLKAITGGPSSARHKLSDPFPGARREARHRYPVTESQDRQTWTTNTASSTHVPCPLRSWRPTVSGRAEDG